jgi:ketosteroid isomerase-like protein
MSERLVEQFIAALGELEQSGDAAPMIALFAEASEVGNVARADGLRGKEGAREFWTAYRAAFGEVRSSFRTRVVGEGAAALEWTTEGTSAEGGRVAYGGVSLLEMAGGEITRFHAYFDPHHLGRQLAEGVGE